MMPKIRENFGTANLIQNLLVIIKSVIDMEMCVYS